MKKFAFFVLCSLLALCGCQSSAQPEPEQPAPAEPPESQSELPTGFSQLAMPADGEEYAVLTTDYGEIALRLFPEYAPNAVQNFITHIKDGYYDGITFHRIAENFVIQGGDPLGTGTGGESIWGEGFEIEPHPLLRHYSGALGMARNPNDTASNGSQFYIVQSVAMSDEQVEGLNEIKANLDAEVQEGAGVTWGELFPGEVIDKYIEIGGTPALDYGYTIFGQVISGMDTVAAIAAVEVGENERPVNEVIITKAEIRQYGE